MTTLTMPAPQVSVFDSPGEEPISLFQLGALFVIRTSYWSCRVSNEPADLELSPERIDAQAIASFGTKDLVDPEQGRKVFQAIEKKARHLLAKHSRPFATAGAHFVPWQHAAELIDQLEQIKAEFDQAVETFVQQYPQLRAEWQAAHPDVPDAAYPPVWELRRRFAFGWHTFKVSGVSDAEALDDVETELARRQVRDEQLEQMKQNLEAECRQFATDYVTTFRQEVASFCDQVIEANGKVHGKTLQAIRRKIDHFHQMNVFNDADAATQLQQLKVQIAGVSGEDLAQQPALAKKLNVACAALKNEILDPDSISAITGRLKRRVVLD
jgi:hypothetical protein